MRELTPEQRDRAVKIAVSRRKERRLTAEQLTPFLPMQLPRPRRKRRPTAYQDRLIERLIWMHLGFTVEPFTETETSEFYNIVDRIHVPPKRGKRRG